METVWAPEPWISVQDRDAAGEREIGWMIEQRSFRRMTFALHDRRSAQARRPHFVEMFDTAPFDEGYPAISMAYENSLRTAPGSG